MQTYLADLCASISVSLVYDQTKIRLVSQSDELMMSADASMSLGLIATELVINALKHAFPGRRTGSIEVTFNVQGTAWALSVADDGIGRPENPQDSKPGLGTSIISSLSKHLNADVRIEQANPGTVVTVRHASQPCFGDGAIVSTARSGK